MVRNHHLAKSISDAAWSQFREWLEYFGKVFGVAVIAVPPHNTSQDCSNCGQKVQKTLSTRTHKCHHCSYIQDRDINAAINILKKALEMIATPGALLGETPRPHWLKNIVGHTEFKACGEFDRCLEGVTPKSKSSRGSRKSRK